MKVMSFKRYIRLVDKASLNFIIILFPVCPCRHPILEGQKVVIYKLMLSKRRSSVMEIDLYVFNGDLKISFLCIRDGPETCTLVYDRTLRFDG